MSALPVAEQALERAGRRLPSGLYVEVVVYRDAGANKPVGVVGQGGCMPPRGQYVYRQHVLVARVIDAVERWLEGLPADYCLDGPCADVVRREWRRLITDFLATVPCVGSWADVVERESRATGAN